MRTNTSKIRAAGEGVMPLDDMLNALFTGFAPVTDRRTDMRDCANYFEPLNDEEEEQ